MNIEDYEDYKMSDNKFLLAKVTIGENIVKDREYYLLLILDDDIIVTPVITKKANPRRVRITKRDFEKVFYSKKDFRNKKLEILLKIL